MWKKLLLVVLVVAGAGAALVANRVKHAPPVQVQRGTFILAPPATIIAEIANLRNWIAWLHEKDDSTLRRTYGGPPSGRGASYYWSSTDGTVEGRLTVISVKPDSVELELEQVAPNQRLTDYTIQATPEGSGSRLVWSASRDGDDFMAKALGKVEKRDQRMGSEVENGLAKLKTVLEAQSNMQAYRVERSITIAAPDVLVLAEIMDFREWSKWVPRERLDPGLKRVFSGTDAQPGSTYYWSGNDEVGAGRVSMISSSAEKVELEVELDRPIDDCVSDFVFTLAPEGSGIRVVWTVTGQKSASGKALSLLGSTPEMLAGEMEEGLAAMKALAESSMSQRPGSVRPQVALKKPYVAPTLVGVAAPAKIRRIVLEPIVMNGPK